MTDPTSKESEASASNLNEASTSALNSRDLNHDPQPRDDSHNADDKKMPMKEGNETRDSADFKDGSINVKKTTHADPTITKTVADEQLPDNVQQDPRGDGDILQRMTKKATKRGNGRNTESFDPKSTLVRPDVRVLVGNPTLDKFNKTLKHDDVVVVPELFGPEDDWSLYYKLVQELTELQKNQVKGSEFISWHEGSHLICKEPKESPTFQMILKRLCDYFDIDASSAGTRFNWYKDSQDWKPFHHDSAAFNPKRAKSQNITVGVSFGATRELAFIRAAPEHLQNDPQFQYYQEQHKPCRMYFPQTNNGVFTFGRDVNIQWKHGVNALPSSEQSNKGRISIILWGLARNVVDEPNSPPLLGADGQGPHANRDRNHHHRGGRRGGDGGGNSDRRGNRHHDNKRRRQDHRHDDRHHHHHHRRNDDRYYEDDRSRRQDDRQYNYRDDDRRHDDDYDHHHHHRRRYNDNDRRDHHGKENGYAYHR